MEIQKYPVGILISLNLAQRYACLAECLLHVIGKRLDLAAVRTVRDNEIIGDHGYFTDINGLDLFRLFVLQCPDGQSGDLYTVHICTSLLFRIMLQSGPGLCIYCKRTFSAGKSQTFCLTICLMYLAIIIVSIPRHRIDLAALAGKVIQCIA